MVISLHLFFPVARHWLLSPEWLGFFWAWHFKATQHSYGFTFLLLIPYLITTVDSHCSFNMCWLLPRPCLCSLRSVFWKALLPFFLSHFNPSFQVSDIMFPFPSNFLRSHTSQSNLSISNMYFSWDTAFFCFTCFYLFILYVYLHICAYVPWCACSSEDSSWELILPFYHVGSGESDLAASAPTHWAILPVLFCCLYVPCFASPRRHMAWKPDSCLCHHWIPSHSTITYIQEQLSFCSLGTLSVSLRVPSCRIPF